MGNIFQGLATTGYPEGALELINTLAEPYLTKPALRAKMHYLLSMICLRDLKLSNLARAEEHMLNSLDYIGVLQRGRKRFTA